MELSSNGRATAASTWFMAWGRCSTTSSLWFDPTSLASVLAIPATALAVPQVPGGGELDRAKPLQLGDRVGILVPTIIWAWLRDGVARLASLLFASMVR
jgi:hypothetical protein